MIKTTGFLPIGLCFFSIAVGAFGFSTVSHPPSVNRGIKKFNSGEPRPWKHPANTVTSRTATSNRVSAIPSILAFGVGKSSATMISLGREAYNLQSMAAYSTVTALIMNASLRLYTSQKFSQESKIPSALFTAATTLCIISGIYTAVLFNVLGIYSKESLGMGNDIGYIAFQQATAVYRKWGFRSFLATCISFVGGFMLSVFGNVTEGGSEVANGVDKLILGGSIILTLLGAFQIKVILNLATRYIYSL